VFAVEWPKDHPAPGNRELLSEGARQLPVGGELAEGIVSLITAQSDD